MVLYLIGIGLGDERDITVRGLDAVKACDVVYLEGFTSKLYGTDKEKLEAFYGRKIAEVDRQIVESECDNIVNESKIRDVALLVVGDPFGATTHAGISVRARELGVKVEVIHNASIMTAVGKCGLQLYSFGQAVSIVFYTDSWKPLSFYDKIYENLRAGLHTLCLLDIRIREQSEYNVLRGIKEYEPPRFMRISDAVRQLFQAQEVRRYDICLEEMIGVGFARVGSCSEVIKSGTLAELASYDFGEPLHTLVITGNMHYLELELVRSYSINPKTFSSGS